MKLGLLVPSMLVSTLVGACPFCNSATATEIRASLFGDDFVFNLLVTLLPFVIFAAVAYVLYYGVPARKDRASTFTPKNKRI